MGGSFSFDKERVTTQDKNLRFYRNEIKSDPWFGFKIDEMLKWKGEYSKLESKHDYIQWLFPIPDSRGMNYSAQPLLEEEAKAIREDDRASARVCAAYRMMLDFYGMFLDNENNGIVRRKTNFQERYDNLKRNTHNFRRITRILTSLGELGYERFQVPWVTFLMEEIIVYKLLPNLNGGCMAHWIDAIKDKEERYQMYKTYANLEEGRPTSSTYNDSDKTEIDNTNSNYEATKVDEHVHTLVHAADCSPFGGRIGESPDNVKDINEDTDINTANNSKIPAINETVGQRSDHNHSAMAKATDGFERRNIHTASSIAKINDEHSVSFSKTDEHIFDANCSDGVNNSDASCVNDCNELSLSSEKTDARAKDASCDDEMEHQKTIPVKTSRFVNCEASGSFELNSLEPNIVCDRMAVDVPIIGHARTGVEYNASRVCSKDKPDDQNVMLELIENSELNGHYTPDCCTVDLPNEYMERI